MSIRKQFLSGRFKMKQRLAVWLSALFLFASLPVGAEEGKSETGQGTGFLQGLTDILGGVAKEGMQKAMDEWLGTYKGRIGQVELVKRQGNALVLDVTYENVKRADGVHVDGRILEGGFPLDGFETNLLPIQAQRGRVRLTIRKSESAGGSGWGISSEEAVSDQVELFLIRKGHEDRPFGNLVYDLAKTWSDSDAPDEPPQATGEEAIALAEGETKPLGPIILPGTVLEPVKTAGTGTQTVKPSATITPAATLAALKIKEYDFYANAAKAKWRNASTDLPFPGQTNDSRGFVCVMASGQINPNNAAQHILQTHPEWKDGGLISGLYPDMVLDDNMRFRAVAGFLKGATQSDGAVFVVIVSEGGRGRTVLRQRVTQERFVQLDADLKPWAGKKVGIVLRVEAGAKSTQDWVVWVKPRLEQVLPR
jgi:hypothetical protein